MRREKKVGENGHADLKKINKAHQKTEILTEVVDKKWLGCIRYH